MNDDWFYDPENMLTNSERDAFLELLERERHFMVVEGYHKDIQKAALRKKAVKIIAQRSRTENFDAFVPYLAMTYFDRYLSRNQVPAMRRTLEEDLDLLATCCLILASKMRSSAFKVETFLIKNYINMDKKMLVKMEKKILTKLGWRLRSITALGFLRYYATKLDDPRLVGNFPTFVPRNFQQIVVQTEGDIKFTRFRPSLIAASTLLALCFVRHPKTYYPFFKETFLSYNEFTEEPLSECVMEMKRLLVEKNIVVQNPNDLDWNPPSRPRGGPSQPSDPEGSSGGSLLQQRSGKAPMEEIEEVPVEETRAEYTVMNFELNWYDPEAPDEPIIDTRHLQPAATSEEEERETEQAQRFNQCCGCNVL